MSSPLWRWIALGWLVTSAALAWSFRSYPDAEALADVVEAHSPEWELEQLSRRELLSLPSIGPARAEDLVEARWSAPPEQALVLEDVPGIGPATAKVVRSTLDERARRPRFFGRSSPPPFPPAQLPSHLGRLPGPSRAKAAGPSGPDLGTLGPHGTLPNPRHRGLLR